MAADPRFFTGDLELELLLLHIVQGKQIEAEALLQKNPSLLLRKGRVTDYSQRTFINVSALQCAMWALDTRYMTKMILDCIPTGEDGDAIRIALLSQYDEINRDGIQYDFYGERHTESRYDFSLIPALRTYVENFDHWSPDQRGTHWLTFVGQEQRKIPAHVAQHYCDTSTVFSPPPTFKSASLKRDLTFCNYSNNVGRSLFPLSQLFPLSSGSGLGFDFAVFRERAKWCCGGAGAPAKARLENDLETLSVLHAVRKADSENLRMCIASPEHHLEEDVSARRGCQIQ